LVLSRFSTGSADDAVAPALPLVLDRDRTINSGNRSSCPGPTVLATFEVDHEAGLLVVDRDGTAIVQSDRPDGLVTTLSPRHHVSVGRSPCFENWPEAAEAARTRVRFGAYDLAGNFSGWSEYEEVLIQPENEPLACRVSASNHTPLWLTVPGLLWVVARRRN
jgi:hypothetical protein